MLDLLKFKKPVPLPEPEPIEDPRVTNALEMVNEIRDWMHQPPLKELQPGIPGDAAGCPIARSIAIGTTTRVHVSGYNITIYRPFRRRKFRDARSGAFVSAFDTGQLSQYQYPNYKDYLRAIND